MKLALSAILMGVLGLPVACTDQTELVLHFRNDTQHVVDVSVLNPDSNFEDVIERDIQPGQTTTSRGDVFPGARCSNRGVLIARDKQGKEVARHTGNTCPGDTWIIQTAAPSRSGATASSRRA